MKFFAPAFVTMINYNIYIKYNIIINNSLLLPASEARKENERTGI